MDRVTPTVQRTHLGLDHAVVERKPHPGRERLPAHLPRDTGQAHSGSPEPAGRPGAVRVPGVRCEVEDRNAAILRFRRHGSTNDDRRQAVRDLADVLEYLRHSYRNGKAVETNAAPSPTRFCGERHGNNDLFIVARINMPIRIGRMRPVDRAKFSTVAGL